MEFQSVFCGDVVIAASVQESIFRIEVRLERQGGLRFIIDVVYLVSHHFTQGFGNGHAVQMHAGRVGLHHGRVRIDVYDQSRQVIAFPGYQAVGVVVRPSGNAYAAPHVVSNLQFVFPESGVDFLTLPEAEHAHGDAAYLPVSFGDEFAFGCIDIHHFSFLGLSFEAGDGS